MKIGIFDSGLGGLIIARAIRKMLSKYDYIYFGDTKRVPYGNKSHEAVFEFTREAVNYLFRKENCALVIIACNTASARALKEIQQEKHFKDRKVLGVLIPAAEVASKYKRIGVLATLGTVASNAWAIEIKKLNSKAKVFQSPAPMLVPLIEEGDNKLAKPFLLKYLRPLSNKKLDALVLGCTHYPLLKKEIREILPKKIKIISQDEIVPKKLKEYLERHPEITRRLSDHGSIKMVVTDKTQNMNRLVKRWFGGIIKK
ncbi:glutamate racemase [Candidatus Nomurabacteria bacterium RIFCSPLOWO2_01_FULL_40_18]|uniref:Glutamate racemase n=1 Tax=Candidatus Nomurabacteria bacterium RIFCSPLOWO2_01_FULL_40_18 TaxID=1801773 RepID=A0A1F6XHB2_9BACT|nr:MAG: glutamate racemase [Candidatus Nomurabacteria bacterium RIFCSPLOWO2_01_FULL_40_18]